MAIHMLIALRGYAADTGGNIQNCEGRKMSEVIIVQFSDLPQGWMAEEASNTEVHIYPVEDWRIHTLTDHCFCNPTVEYVYMSRKVNHHSFDGRETDESPTSGYIN